MISKDSNVNMPRYFVNQLNVPLLPQELYYWCGPASAQQALAVKQSNYKSQSQLANLLGTTENAGTAQTVIAGVLNSELGINRYTQAKVDDMTINEFYSKIKNSIDLGYAPIINIRMQALPAYNNSASGGHYITISGHTITSILGNDYSPISVYYVDPNKFNSYGYGNHAVSLPTLKSANGGYLIYAV